MSKFLDDFTAALEKVSAGNAESPETKAAIDELVAKTTELAEKLANNAADDEASDAILEEHEQAILALVNKLAVSTPTEAPTETPTEAPTEAPVEVPPAA